VDGAAPTPGEVQELDQRERAESRGRFGVGIVISGCSGGEVGLPGQRWDHAGDRQRARGGMHALQMRWPKSSLEVESYRRRSDSCCAKVTLNPHTQKPAYAAPKFSPAGRPLAMKQHPFRESGRGTKTVKGAVELTTA